MKSISAKDVIALLEDDVVLQSVYRDLFPAFEKHVLKNSGTKQDAEDVFQESMAIVYRKALDPRFTLTVKLETFIFSVGKNKWLHELRSKKNSAVTIDVSNLEEIDDSLGNDLIEMVINEEKIALYLRYFKDLSKGCKDVLELFYKRTKMKEIASQMGFSSEGYARKRKHDCQEKLVELITKDPIFSELKNE